MKKIIAIISIAVGLTFSVNAQDFHMPQPSPTVSIYQNFSTSSIQLEYSRPSLKGRKMFGHQLPYGTIWRTGANSPTKITFGEDVTIAEQLVKAGSYEMYTIPNKKEWEILLNSDLNNWDNIDFRTKNNFISFNIPVESGNKQETFSISIENMIDGTTADLILAWDKVRVVIPIKADNNQRILDYLDKGMQSEHPPYGMASSYLLSTNQQMGKALEYVNKAIEIDPNAFYLFWRRSQIELKLGMKNQAVDSAKKAMDLAENVPGFAEEYKAHYEDMLKMAK